MDVATYLEALSAADIATNQKISIIEAFQTSVTNLLGPRQDALNDLSEVDNLNVTNTGGTITGAIVSNTYEIARVEQKIADQIASVTRLTTRIEALENGSSSGSGGSGGLTTAEVNGLIDAAIAELTTTIQGHIQTLAGTQDTRDTGQDGLIAGNTTAAGNAQSAAEQAGRDAAAAQSTATANSGLIATNTADIATNAEGIATNAGNIATNAGNISANSDAIAGNSAAISVNAGIIAPNTCLLYTSPSPRDRQKSRMPSSA